MRPISRLYFKRQDVVNVTLNKRSMWRSGCWWISCIKVIRCLGQMLGHRLRHWPSINLAYHAYRIVLFFLNTWRMKGFFYFEIIINVLVSSFRFIWIPMLWVYGHYIYLNSFRGSSSYVNFKWLRIVHICLISAQIFANLDVTLGAGVVTSLSRVYVIYMSGQDWKRICGN